MKVITHSETETKKIASVVASKLKGGETIGLIGDLGSGKTAFVKGLAIGLGIKSRITSPTFVLMKVYKVKHTTIKHLVHVDAYRVKQATALQHIGLEEYIKAKDAVVVIEWADMVQSILPKKRMIYTFTHTPDNLRVITSR